MTDEIDDYGNPIDGDEQIYCSFPDCGCDGARNCDAKTGPNRASMILNIEKRKAKGGGK